MAQPHRCLWVWHYSPSMCRTSHYVESPAVTWCCFALITHCSRGTLLSLFSVTELSARTTSLVRQKEPGFYLPVGVNSHSCSVLVCLFSFCYREKKTHHPASIFYRACVEHHDDGKTKLLTRPLRLKPASV